MMRAMNSEKIKDVILYILFKLGGRLSSRTKLVKLLYFIDLKAKQQLGRKITDIRYIYHYYGPYSPSIINAVHELEEDGRIIEEYDPFYGVYKYFIVSDAGVDLDPEEKKIIDEVLKQYGSKTAKELKELAYEELHKEKKQPGDVVL